MNYYLLNRQGKALQDIGNLLDIALLGLIAA
jgi:hypothetical protein